LYGYRHDTVKTSIRGPAKGACPGSTYEGVDAMGRGRQKAKQTKVARQLKYFSPDTDYTALQRELSGSNDRASVADDDYDDDEDTESDDDSDDDGSGEQYADRSAGGRR
jgi:hypothetical protein